MNLVEYLKSKNACSEGVAFAEGKTLGQAWKKCTRPDWMMWLYRINNPDKKICVMIACYSARQSLKYFTKRYPDDKRPLEAIEAAERWIENPSQKITSATSAASATSAVYATSVAAYAAAYAAASAVANATESKMKIKICKYIRELLPKITIEEIK